jgi:hypothetical protein
MEHETPDTTPGLESPDAPAEPETPESIPDIAKLEPTTDPAAPSPTAIRLQYRSTRGDLFRAGMYEGRRSDLLFALGVGAFAAAAGSVLIRDVVTFVAMLLIGASLITGAFYLPFVWWATRQRPDLVGAEAVDVINDHGIHETTPKITADLDWSLYREVSETRHAFYLSTGTGRGWIPKRAFSETDLVAFRRLIAERGLVKRPRRLRRILVVVAVALVFAAITFGSLAVTFLTASPRLDLSPAITGRTVSVHASTDLPDGALVSVEIIQIDEYARSLASGGPATVESPWVRYTPYVAVKDGAFDATFDATGWPAGRGRAVAFFDLAIQPGNVAERYGGRGEHLTGPWVKDDPEDGRRLEVVAAFTLE